jgi:hypothetical protein
MKPFSANALTASHAQDAISPESTKLLAVFLLFALRLNTLASITAASCLVINESGFA